MLARREQHWETSYRDVNRYTNQLAARDGRQRDAYTWCTLHAARLARHLGQERITVVEFGVAGGKGLLALEQAARWAEECYEVAVDVVGFDSGLGLGAPKDARDLPNIWSQGDFVMDEGRLRAQLERAELVLGWVADTLPAWLGRDPAPVGFCAFDVDQYRATVDALQILQAPLENLLPRVHCLFDDVLGYTFGDRNGERLAIHEFNERDRVPLDLADLRPPALRAPTPPRRLLGREDLPRPPHRPPRLPAPRRPGRRRRAPPRVVERAVARPLQQTPGMAETQLIPADRLRQQLEALLETHGVPADEAAVVVDNLVEADLRGVDSHGAHLMALYAARLSSGHLRPVTKVSVVRDDGSTVLLDGGLGFGQVAGIQAMDLACERAKEHGTAAVTVKESTHLGALAYYTLRAAGRGCFAMAFQNGPTFVPPFGGTTGIFSTNPFSYAIPAGEERDVVYDVATTAVAGNKILLAKKRGDTTIPEGWANDAQGRPTTDAQAASVDHLQWFGGHKGFGLGFLVEVLAGVLADSCYGRTENSSSELRRPRPHRQGLPVLGARREPLPARGPVPVARRHADPRRALGDARRGRRPDLRARRDRARAPGGPPARRHPAAHRADRRARPAGVGRRSGPAGGLIGGGAGDGRPRRTRR